MAKKMGDVLMEVTVKFRYTANPDNYDTNVPKEMAKIDADQLRNMPDVLSDMIITDQYEVTVTPV
jgi:hypothetical protein